MGEIAILKGQSSHKPHQKEEERTHCTQTVGEKDRANIADIAVREQGHQRKDKRERWGAVRSLGGQVQAGYSVADGGEGTQDQQASGPAL